MKTYHRHPQEDDTPTAEEGKGGQHAAASSSVDTQIHELTAQISSLRGMGGVTRPVAAKRYVLLQLVVGELRHALGETRESLFKGGNGRRRVIKGFRAGVSG